MLQGNRGNGRHVEIARSHDQLAVRSNPGLRSVIGAPVLVGNVVAEMPVLFSDGPCWWVDDEEKQDDQDLFRCPTLLSVLIGSPASAQHMIDEPGMYAFYHPNGDLGIGSARSPVNAQAMVPRLVMRHPIARLMKSRK